VFSTHLKIYFSFLFQNLAFFSLKKILPKGADGGKCVGRTRHDAFGEKIRAEIE
jgi:hypothetical protein